MKTKTIILSAILLTGVMSLVTLTGQGVYAQLDTETGNDPNSLINQISRQVVAANPNTNADYVQQLLTSIATQTTQTLGQEKALGQIREVYGQIISYPYGITSQALSQLAQTPSGANIVSITQQIAQENSRTNYMPQSIVNVAFQPLSAASGKNIIQLIDETSQIVAKHTTGVSAKDIDLVIRQISLQSAKANGAKLALESIQDIANIVKQEPKGPVAQALIKLAKLNENNFGNTDEVVKIIDRNIVRDNGQTAGNKRIVERVTSAPIPPPPSPNAGGSSAPPPIAGARVSPTAVQPGQTLPPGVVPLPIGTKALPHPIFPGMALVTFPNGQMTALASIGLVFENGRLVGFGGAPQPPQICGLNGEVVIPGKVLPGDDCNSAAIPQAGSGIDILRNLGIDTSQVATVQSAAGELPEPTKPVSESLTAVQALLEAEVECDDEKDNDNDGKTDEDDSDCKDIDDEEKNDNNNNKDDEEDEEKNDNNNNKDDEEDEEKNDNNNNKDDEEDEDGSSNEFSGGFPDGEESESDQQVGY